MPMDMEEYYQEMRDRGFARQYRSITTSSSNDKSQYLNQYYKDGDWEGIMITPEQAITELDSYTDDQLCYEGIRDGGSFTITVPNETTYQFIIDWVSIEKTRRIVYKPYVLVLRKDS